MTILRCIARRPAASPFRAAASAASVCDPQSSDAMATRTPSFARSLHRVTSLARHDELDANGVPGLFSQKGFQIAFSEKQAHLINDLNNETQGTQLQGADSVQSVAIETARDPMRAHIFNLASMAFNNNFFFRGINSNPDVDATPPSDLLNSIKTDFGSMDTLRETFLATASAMFGPGFVWLVQIKTNEANAGSLRILPTYLAGSPLSGAHYRRQSHDLNTHNAESHAELNKPGSFGAAHNKAPKKPLGGTDIVPLLCVNTWEHVWLHDYGVAGKDAYLRAWWKKIDWNHVAQSGSFDTRRATKQSEGNFMY
ncbi:hypothetical protein N0V86_004420 [Didymella sp. IMI 355093]|nr:hypothetical protein N0V86_004420 [Didymella sp. IMI 355093]